jgi:ADP-ribose pyrophosphatase
MKKIIPDDCVLVPDQAERVFKGMIFDVYQWPQKLFDGSGHTFEMLKRTDTVTVIGITEDKIIVIDDEQPHLGKRKSFPGGRVDDSDETVLDAAKREMLEETGYSFNSWRLVEVRQPYRKIEWFVYVFIAFGQANKQEPHLDAGEKIAASYLKFEDLKDLVLGGTGYLGESRDLFKQIDNLQQLQDLQEFNGQIVER